MQPMSEETVTPVSVEVVFKVRYKNHQYDVEVRYNPGKSVAGVKDLIVAKLNALRAFQPPAGPVFPDDLTLKMSDGGLIVTTRIPKGDEFFADLEDRWIDEQSGARGNLDIEEIIRTLCDSPKCEQSELNESLEFLYSVPSDAYYRLFEVDYLVLPKSEDTASKPIYILTAPSGSGKTKFMFDLALYKGHYVIYIDWTRILPLVEMIASKYFAIFSDFVDTRLEFTDEERMRSRMIFENCILEGIGLLTLAMKWLSYFADRIFETHSPDEFLHFWVEKLPNVQERIMKLISLKVEAPPLRYDGFIFAFDECQRLLQYLNNGEVYTFEDSDDTTIMHRGSLYTLFSRVCEQLSTHSKVLIGGTSIKLSLMSKHASLMRKGLFLKVKPPMFTEQVSRAFLIRFGIPDILADESKSLLVGRPISAKFFVQAWRSLSEEARIGIHPIALRPMLVNSVIEKLTDVFKRKDAGDSSVFFSRVGEMDKNLSLRLVLSDLCLNGYVSTLGLRHPSVLEEVCTLFLPLVHVKSKNCWRYEENDPIAFQALLRYLHDSNEAIAWDKMSAERLFYMILQQRAVTGEIGEFIMESFLMYVSKSRLDISEFKVFSKLRDTVYGNCYLELEVVSREETSFFGVLDNCDFGTLCINVDKMARFDFFFLMRPRNNDYVVAVFGGCKMYSRNVGVDVFCDNICSTDPDLVFQNAAGDVLNLNKRNKFIKIWRQFITKHKVKILRVIFTYPQPVGTVECPDVLEVSDDQLCLFLGRRQINDLSTEHVDAEVLASSATGCKIQERRGENKRLRDVLLEFRENKKQKSEEKQDIQFEHKNA